MISFLKEKNLSSDLVSKLQDYIERAEFDTDSIYMDLMDGIGNIKHHINDKTVILMTQFIQTNEGMTIFI